MELGRVVAAWGVKGWIKVHSYTENRENILDHAIWRVGKKGQKRRVLAGQLQGNSVVAQLEGIATRDEALSLVGKMITIPASELPELRDGEYYWAQIEGLKVVTPSGQDLGVVDHLMATGANDVMSVRSGNGETLVPYVADVVKQVDLESGIVEVDWELDDK